VSGSSRPIPIEIGGVSFLVETTAVGGRSEPTSSRPDRAREAVVGAFDRAQEAILAVGRSTAATVNSLGHEATAPHEVEVKFGLKFTAESSIVIAGASSEASLEVTLKYKRQQESSSGFDA
jgi:Trypsin-co-occurring domain 1